MTVRTATQELGTEKIPGLLLRYAIPSIIAMTAASLYNIVDSIFIGHGVDPLALAGLTVTLPLMNIAAAFGSLVGIGASSLISIKLGQKDHASAQSILGNVLLLNIILGFAFGFICLLFLDRILTGFSASPDTIGYARDYMRIILCGTIFTHIYLGLNNTLRAVGFPKKSMGIMLTAIISNCILDALFILVFKWGVAGAAWATLIAQVIAMTLEFIHFTNPKYDIHFKKSMIRLRGRIIKGILSIGLAPFLMNITTSVIVIFINNALKNNGGDIYIAAYGNVNRVAFLILMIVMGLNQGMQPIVGYNFGAKKFARVRQTLNLGIAAAVTVTSVGFIMTMTIPDKLAMMFTTDPILLSVSERGMRIVTLAFPIVGFQMVVSNFFQSIGKANKAIFLSLTRQLIFLLPLLIIMPPIFGSDGVWMSMPIADVSSAGLAAILLYREYKSFKRNTNIPTRL